MLIDLNISLRYHCFFLFLRDSIDLLTFSFSSHRSGLTSHCCWIFFFLWRATFFVRKARILEYLNNYVNKNHDDDVIRYYSFVFINLKKKKKFFSWPILNVVSAYNSFKFVPFNFLLVVLFRLNVLWLNHPIVS